MPVIDYLIVGVVTKDVTADGYTIGGTVTYAGLTAARLGARVAVVTSASDDLDLPAHMPGVELRTVKSEYTTTFINTYDARGNRTQRLLARSSQIRAEDVPVEWRDARIVHLAPLAAEFGPELVTAFPRAGVLGVTPQGWMRAWDATGVVSPIPPPQFTAAERARVDAVIFSDADFGHRWDEIERFAASTNLSIVTQGDRGARLYASVAWEDFPAYAAVPLDPTGAGDVFAAAFLYAWERTGDRREAVDFANCVASFSIEDVGTTSLPDSAAIQARRQQR